jgi:FlaA1/EpsC-like NDP-sugar epimerase
MSLGVNLSVKIKNLTEKITFRQAPLRNRLLLFGDIFLIAVAVLGSFALRFEFGALFWYYLPQAWRMIALAILIKPLVYYFFGLYRRLWAYASIRELMLIVVAVTTASIFLSVAMVGLIYLQVSRSNFIGFPRPVLVIDWLLSIILVGGLRFSSRLIAETRSTAAVEPSDRWYRRVLIIGAGDAGALVAREIQKNPQLNLELVCFLDDDKAKQKLQIHGIPVVGPLDELPRVITRRRIHEVIIAIPTAPGEVVRKVANFCHEKNVPFRTMPGVYELIGGKVSVNRLREVNINDLLRRAPARIDDRHIGSTLGGKRVLVTGAGGSIGSEICRQVARWGPSALILLGHGENSVFETLLEMEESFPALPMYPVIADIRDQDRIEAIFASLQPQVVFHAAAHKHVPLMEVNVEEAITNNVLGTRNIVETSLTYDIERLVMISTDKAIRPSSVYGATKRLAELLVLDAARRSERSFSVVRFGNVLGSRGSVVPRFQRQIEAGGPVTITHPDMRRYFMTIPEAVHLVLQAGSMGKGGEVFVLRMGEQVRILDLAEDLIRLSGLEPGKDIEILFTGIRPGEKLSEELWDSWATYEPTDHPDIVLLADEDIISDEKLYQTVDELIHLAREGYPSEIVTRLDRLIPGASVRATPPPDLTSYI